MTDETTWEQYKRLKAEARRHCWGELDAFTKGYVATALWISTDDRQDPERGGPPLDANYGPEDLSPEALASMVEDCRHFQEQNKTDIGDRLDEAGADFWLTRNGHGAGFWDGDWPRDAGERLTENAKTWGSADLYVGDDERIYSS